MSDEASRSFMTLVLNGDILPEEIDDFVDEWHESEQPNELNEYLGMTPQEYSLWVSSPASLGLIIAARHNHQPLTDAVNDNLNGVQKIAARTDESWKIKILRDWISTQTDR